MTIREEILDEAKSNITGQRAEDYGDVEDNFTLIAGYWTDHLRSAHRSNVEVTASDVAVMMIQLKLARLGSNPTHEDSWVDVAGYAGCGGELAELKRNATLLHSAVKDFTDYVANTPEQEIPGSASFGVLEHTNTRLVCHSRDKCKGEFCTVHKRSDHSMRAFRQHWRSDRGIMERLCPHGVGHPDPDSPWPPGDVKWSHGCDGCCVVEEAA